MTLEEIYNLLADDIAAVNKILAEPLSSNSTINNVLQHLFTAGGKRLRPLLLLLTAKALDYKGSDHIILAAVIEYLHSATLLHDDVLDDAEKRRGQSSTHVLWGNKAAILVGDYLCAHSLFLVNKLHNPEINTILTKALSDVVTGEILQLDSSSDYLEVITKKTAQLFVAAVKLGVIITDQAAQYMNTMSNFALNFGIAYQMADDIHDRDSAKIASPAKIQHHIDQALSALEKIPSSCYKEALQSLACEVYQNSECSSAW